MEREATRLDILAVSYGGAHANALIPVIQELRQSGLSVSVLGLTTALSIYQKKGVDPISISKAVAMLPDSTAIMDLGRWALDNTDISQHPSVSHIDTQAYYGAGLWSLSEQFGAGAAQKTFLEKGRFSFCPVAFATAFLEQLSPKLLLTTNAPRSEKAFVEGARLCGIKSAVMVEGFAEIEKQWLGSPNYANELYVFNDWVKRRLLDAGRLETEVFVTGSPAYDRLASLNCEVRFNHTKRILYLSQNESLIGEFSTDDEMASLPREVIDLLTRMNAEGLFRAEVRFHPSQDLDLIGDLSGLDHFPDASLEERLMAADIVMTASSSTGIEAQLLGKPVVEIGWSKRSGLVPFAKIGPHVLAEEPANLGLAVERASVIDLDRQLELGGATDAVVSRIRALLGK